MDNQNSTTKVPPKPEIADYLTSEMLSYFEDNLIKYPPSHEPDGWFRVASVFGIKMVFTNYGVVPQRMPISFEIQERYIVALEEAFSVFQCLLNYLNAEIKYTDALGWLKWEEEQAALPPPIQIKERRYPGFVYLLHSDSGYYKIGRTSDPKNRQKTFEVKLPFQIEFDHVFPTNDMIVDEKRLHCRFGDKRISGEWFSLTEEDVVWIKSLKSGDDLNKDQS